MKVGDRLLLPRRYAVDEQVNGNPIRQLLHPERTATVAARRLTSRGAPDGFVLNADAGRAVLLLGRRPKGNEGFDQVLVARPGVPAGDRQVAAGVAVNAAWVGAPDAAPSWRAPGAAAEEARRSWDGAFAFREEVKDADGKVTECGLRPPQVGALYAVLAHWRGVADPATVVMPTGTGKTETMLAILARERMPRLLVVVPGNALRDQIAGKFETFGLLRTLGVLGPGALFPVVCTLRHRPRSVEEAEDIFLRCNVVVASMQVLQGCGREVQERIAQLCGDLFIDEAHHAPAPTWSAFRKLFLAQPGNRALHFTATPFRTDGKLVEGRVIFSYPLAKAQADGYFVPIALRSVMAWERPSADEAIAAAAIEQLDADTAAGYRHVVMARTEDINRALEVIQVYARLAPHHGPTLVHSRMPEAEREAALARLRGGTARIIVCVNMLGEGFDFPNLKIAAVHDSHKSLAITLQFTGRFTRAHSDLGQATVVANVASPDMEDRLRDLYAEDADWNRLLTELSSGAVGRHTRRSDFLDGFTGPPSPVALQNVFPKMSAVVYRTGCADWAPGRAEGAIRKRARIHAGPLLNAGRRTLVFITQEQEPVPWGAVKEVSNTIWHLYLLHWDQDRGLLFINSSDNGSLHEGLAKAVCGDDVDIVDGDRVFRCLHGVNRLLLMNLGLNHTIGRAVRFSMHTGSDVGRAMTEALVGNKTRSNLFGIGYEAGSKVTVGCSRKGRLWSYLIAHDMAEWVDWCRHVGAKLLDDTIKPEDIFRHAMVPTEVTERPPLVPMAVEWDERLLRKPEHLVKIEVGDAAAPLFDVDLGPAEHTDAGPLRLRVTIAVGADARSSDLEVRFGASGARYVPAGGPLAFIDVGGKRTPLGEWLADNPPWVYFADGSVLRGDELFTPQGVANRIPYSRDRIVAWNWAGTDIRKESQKEQKRPESVQFKVIQSLLAQTGDAAFDIVVDDDDAGEAADVVAIRAAPGRIVVHLYHCKFSKETRPGARLDDLYVVCGQAQKSVRWRGDAEALFRHLQLREGQRIARGAPSRFERGDLAALRRLEGQLRGAEREFSVFIVQPGLSRAAAEGDHLELLAATETYLMETFGLPLGVIASA
ncbi:DEAD/DEAH box helicase [Siccirubricoccus phaeus]|uniref:DEAD/DEAH box helicase n=1 Tax=Siccirubricoccus phaeus TaxID=2595053 RepID=UPI0011F0F1B1|nr:DEAD/DEAH box helicase family protein [Siccirubricoccus phaeus]